MSEDPLEKLNHILSHLAGDPMTAQATQFVKMIVGKDGSQDLRIILALMDSAQKNDMVTEAQAFLAIEGATIMAPILDLFAGSVRFGLELQDGGVVRVVTPTTDVTTDFLPTSMMVTSILTDCAGKVTHLDNYRMVLYPVLEDDSLPEKYVEIVKKTLGYEEEED